MGYIAPVTPYDYIQYTNRTVEAARKEKKIQEVSLIPNVQLFLNEASGWIGYVNGKWPPYSEKNRRQQNVSHVYKKQGESKAIEKAKAKITGKGLTINEVI